MKSKKAKLRLASCLIIIAIWIILSIRAFNYQQIEINHFKDFWKLYYSAFAYGLSIGGICFLLFWLNRDKKFLINPNRPVFKQILFGLPTAIIITTIVYLTIESVIHYFYPELDKETTQIAPFIKQSQYMPFWMLLSVIKSGFAEELLRVSALVHFKAQWGKKGLITALILSSVVYGFSFYYQGWDNVIAGGCRGLLFGGLFIWRGSATELIVGHSFRDMLLILVAYYVL